MDTSKYMHKHLQKKDSEAYPHTLQAESSFSLGCISLLPMGRTYRYCRERGYHSVI